MNYREFFKQIDQLRGAVLFSGEEEYAKQEALKALRKRHLPPGMEALNETVLEGAIDFATLESSCETLPFMGDVRLVVVKDSPLVSSQAKGSVDQALAEDLCQYLPNLPEHSILVFYVHGAVDKRKKLTQAIAAMDRAVDFPMLTEGEALGWAGKYCAAAGKKLEPAAGRKLIEIAGRLLQDVKDGLDKAMAYAGERDSIAANDIDQVVMPTPEYRGYEMASSLLEGNEARTLAMIKQLLLDGEKAISLLASIERAVQQHLSVKLMLDDRREMSQIASALGLPQGAVRAISFRARRMDAGRLMDALEVCSKANLAMRTTASSEDMALSRLYISVFKLMEGMAAKA
ncbi:MAG: DNA polymerase III subunit delta [Christensenellales bacterium]